MTAKARGLGPAAPGELDPIATAKRRSDTAPQVNCLQHHMERQGETGTPVLKRELWRGERTRSQVPFPFLSVVSLSFSLSPFKSTVSK